MRLVQKALTFDDVLLVPAHSRVLPREVSLKTRLSRKIQLNIPLVVRLEGNNVELGRKMMRDSGLPIIPADTMAEAAKKVVRVASKPPDKSA